jgi:hypothetical protein
MQASQIPSTVTYHFRLSISWWTDHQDAPLPRNSQSPIDIVAGEKCVNICPEVFQEVGFQCEV